MANASPLPHKPSLASINKQYQVLVRIQSSWNCHTSLVRDWLYKRTMDRIKYKHRPLSHNLCSNQPRKEAKQILYSNWPQTVRAWSITARFLHFCLHFHLGPTEKGKYAPLINHIACSASSSAYSFWAPTASNQLVLRKSEVGGPLNPTAWHLDCWEFALRGWARFTSISAPKSKVVPPGPTLFYFIF